MDIFTESCPCPSCRLRELTLEFTDLIHASPPPGPADIVAAYNRMLDAADVFMQAAAVAFRRTIARTPVSQTPIQIL